MFTSLSQKTPISMVGSHPFSFHVPFALKKEKKHICYRGSNKNARNQYLWSSWLLDSERFTAKFPTFKIPRQRTCSVNYQWIGEAITA